MTDRLAAQLRDLLPGVPVGRAPVTGRGRAVIMKTRPLESGRFRRSEQVTLKFLADSFGEAKQMYLTVRRAIVSDGNEGRVGEGNDVLVIREVNGADAAGYIPGSGMYHYTATFAVTGY